ncbi:MAG: serine/threonine protein kinase [Chloroflexi bacterium]|nr:serine/threonine protein kinase [Chloroflexota bacterium]
MSTKTDPMIGKVLGDYKIERLLGKGGMAYVYRAKDQQLGRDVAIKVITLQRDRANELMKRFKREARTIGKLDKHPNIITIYRYGTDEEDNHYLAMELIRGETLSQLLTRNKRKSVYMSHAEILQIIRQVADALDYAHQNKVIHRDIKPSNVMLEKSTGRVILMDFGLVMDAEGQSSTLGTAFGTPRYIAPEQAISSQQAVPQSDLYSLGIILYEMLTGQTPFDEESAMSLALSHITNPPPPPQEIRAEIPDAVADVVLKALEKQPEDRYQTAAELVEALEQAFGNLAVDMPDLQLPVDQKEPPSQKAAVAAVGKSTAPDPAPAQAKPESPAKPAPPPKAEKPAREKKAKKDKPRQKQQAAAPQPEAPVPRKQRKGSPVGLLLFLALVVGGAVVAFALLGGSGDENGGDGDRAAAGGQDGDILLVYDNDSFTIFNASQGDIDLTGTQFMLPDHSIGYDTYFVGATTISNFEPGDCIITKIRDASLEFPSLCSEEETEIRGLLQLTRESYYWVWNDEVNEEDTFVVVYNGEVIQTCDVGAGRCAFSLPEPDTEEDAE